jgi:hypothetical protein
MGKTSLPRSRIESWVEQSSTTVSHLDSPNPQLTVTCNNLPLCAIVVGQSKKLVNVMSTAPSATVKISLLNTGLIKGAPKKALIRTESDETLDMPILSFIVEKKDKVYIWVSVLRYKSCFISTW